mmetsp:Transcript_91724/g.296748  ORF Transcript_91724/g.296748 Transcript_91724/m.296748 type:complete len:96 (-) Transcript_91724:1146-1433(-)
MCLLRRNGSGDASTCDKGRDMHPLIGCSIRRGWPCNDSEAADCCLRPLAMPTKDLARPPEAWRCICEDEGEEAVAAAFRDGAELSRSPAPNRDKN